MGGGVTRVLLLLLIALPLSAGELHHVRWRGVERSYVLHVPPNASGAIPLLVALHGSGQPATTMATLWEATADANGFAVVAPQSIDPMRWQGLDDGPGFLHAVIDDVAKQINIDRRRMYLFGHSAGAHFALMVAIVESEYFAAAAVHAGALDGSNRYGLPEARRRIPTALWSGRDDRIVPIDAVRKTVTFLRDKRVTAQLHELRGHDHQYQRVAATINPQIWRFLAGNALEPPPAPRSPPPPPR